MGFYYNKHHLIHSNTSKNSALAETFEILPCEFRSTKHEKKLKKSLNTS